MRDPEALQLATIDWTRGKWSHVKGKYAREHTWHLAGGTKLKATDTDAMLPEGYRDKNKLTRRTCSWRRWRARTCCRGCT